MSEPLNLGNLKPHPKARRRPKRVGRGPGSGHGKTSGRGHKGRGSRAGGNTPPGYEGGQMPLQRRIPKRGFRNPFRVHYEIVNVGQLERFEAGTVVDVKALVESGLVNGRRPIKLLGEGKITKALTLRVDKCSQGASKLVTAAGGVIEGTK